jgi:cyanide hydratase
VTKTCELINEASKNGAELIAFPELWIPGYPTFVFAHLTKVVNEYQLNYYKNAVSVDSTHMARIRKTARASKIMVVLGIAERDRGSLYMAQTFIGAQGDILLHRRKFKPTGPERCIFGDAVCVRPLCGPDIVHHHLTITSVWRLRKERCADAHRPSRWSSML